MRQAPPLKVTRNQIEESNSTADGSPLPYAAALFKGALQVYPAAVMLIAGSSTLAGVAGERLASGLGVPSRSIQIIPMSGLPYQDAVDLVIDYFPDPATIGKKTSAVEFEVKMNKVSVEFEVSPDGAYVEEVKGQWAPLKMHIRKHAALSLVQNLKIGTKIESIFSFDRKTSVQVETSIKNKIKLALSGDTRIPGTKRSINVEFYGAGGFKLQDGAVKPVFEGGLVVTVPFDLF